jgi:hypothetical protein
MLENLACSLVAYVLIGGLWAVYALQDGASEATVKAPAYAKVIGISSFIAVWPYLVVRAFVFKS